MPELFETYKKCPYDEPVDERRNEFHVNFVSTEAITDRLTAQSYRPEIVAALAELRSGHVCHNLRSFAKEQIRQGKTPVYVTDGVPCYKLRDVRHILVDDEPESRVGQQFAKENPKSVVRSDAVFINRSGGFTVGRAGVYLKEAAAVVSDDVFLFQPNDKCDAAFIACFLNSWWGKRALESGITGSTGQLKLPQSHVNALPVPAVPLPVQNAIGNLVRKAQRLRAMARSARANCFTLLSDALALEMPPLGEAKTQWLDAVDFESRLDAKFNSPSAVAARRLVRQHPRAMSIAEISSSINCGPFGSTLTASEHTPDGEVTLIQPTDLAGTVFAINPGWHIPLATLEAKNLPRYEEGTILFSRVGYPYCKVLPKRIQPATISSSMIAARPNQELVNPFFVQAFFEHPIGVAMLESIQKEVAQPTTSTEELASLPIPVVDRDVQDEIGASVQSADESTYLYGQVVADSKTKIEKLLSGAIGERELLEENDGLLAWLESNSQPNHSQSR